MDLQDRYERGGVLLIRELSEIERARARNEMRKLYGANAPLYRIDDIRAVTARIPETLNYRTFLMNLDELSELDLPEKYEDVDDIVRLLQEVE